MVEYKKEGNIVKVDTREEVEEEIMKCLTKRFSLTNQCTSMSRSFITKVGYLAENPGTEMVLQGNIPKAWEKNKDLELFFRLIKYPKTS